MKQSPARLKIILELVWWLFTFFIALLVFIPICRSFDHFPFFSFNLLCVVIFITYTRYIFLLKHTFLARLKNLKIILFFVSIPLIFYLVSGFYNFQVFIDEQGPEALFTSKHLKKAISQADQLHLLLYIKREMVLFSVGAIVVAFLLPFRMLISVWRQINKGTV